MTSSVPYIPGVTARALHAILHRHTGRSFLIFTGAPDIASNPPFSPHVRLGFARGWPINRWLVDRRLHRSVRLPLYITATEELRG